MASPGRELSQPGLSLLHPEPRLPAVRAVLHSAKGPVSRILFICGHSSRRRVAADAHQRPTRRFRQLLRAALQRIGPMRSATPGSWPRASLPIWSCSVWGLPCRWHYCRRGALLPHLFTLTAGLAVQESPSGPRWPSEERAARAVCFLWHWPSTGLEARVPDVIRHTALRSSDFPLPVSPACARLPAATARSSCQCLVYRESRLRFALIAPSYRVGPAHLI